MAVEKMPAVRIDETTAAEKALVAAGIDLTGLSEAEKAELAQIYADELRMSGEGIEFRPSRIKIQKDSCTFVDEFGQTLDELVGVIVFKQRTRGLWEPGNRIPLCSSIDGHTGFDTRTGKARDCATCPDNQWGSGRNEKGEPTRGKACKEMRRVFIAQPDAYVPVFVSLPPTSLKTFDSHISARLSKGIADTAVETIFRLIPEKSEGGFSYAVITCKMGRRLSGQEMLRYIKMRDKVAAAAAKIGITEEDYMQDEAEGEVAGSSYGAGGMDDDQPF